MNWSSYRPFFESTELKILTIDTCFFLNIYSRKICCSAEHPGSCKMSDKKKEATASAQKDESATQAQTKQMVKREDVIYKLRDINGKMVDSWKEIFGSNENFKV